MALGKNDYSPDVARKRHRRTDGLVIENDDWENDEDFVQFLSDAFTNADSVMRPGACFYIWYASQQSFNFLKACEKALWQVRQVLIWNKSSITLGRQDYQWKHEPCLYGWKAGAGHTWCNDRSQSTVIDFERPSRNDIHPTMKPVGLFDYQIQNNTHKNENVLDIFAGSGTTIIACEQNGRNAYCMEYDTRYASAIIDRWEKLTGKEAVLLNGYDE